MSNPMPSPHTRFQPGESGNPAGKPPGTLSRSTILKSLPAVRTLAEVRADPDSWKGSMKQLLESVARDQQNPIDVRLQVAAQLLRLDPAVDQEHQARSIINLDGLTDEERMLLAKLLLKTMPPDYQPQNPPTIEGKRWAPPPGWTTGGAHAPSSPSPADERDELLGKLAKYLPPAEIERLRNEWAK